MAEVRWPPEAVGRLGEIAAYISQFDPAAADTIAQRLITLGESLAHFPNRGRPGPDGTREMTTVPPYILEYEVAGDIVTNLDIRHGRQKPRDAKP